MKQIRPYQLTSWTEEHLIALAQVFNKGHNVNFAFFQAFNNLMKNMELGKFIMQQNVMLKWGAYSQWSSSLYENRAK